MHDIYAVPNATTTIQVVLPDFRSNNGYQLCFDWSIMGAQFNNYSTAGKDLGSVIGESGQLSVQISSGYVLLIAIICHRQVQCLYICFALLINPHLHQYPSMLLFHHYMCAFMCTCMSHPICSVMLCN